MDPLYLTPLLTIVIAVSCTAAGLRERTAQGKPLVSKGWAPLLVGWMAVLAVQIGMAAIEILA